MNLFAPFSEFPRVGAIAKRYYWSIPITAILGLVNGILEGLGIGLLVPLLGTLTQASNVRLGGLAGLLGRFGQNHPPSDRLVMIAGVIFGFVLLKGVTQSASQYFANLIDGRVGHEIRTALSDRIERAGYAFHLSADPVRLVNIVTTEAWKVTDAVRAVQSNVSGLASIVVFSTLLIAISWKLTLLVGAGALLSRLIEKLFITRLRHLSEESGKANESLASRMLFSIYGARLIRLFGQESAEHARFAAASDKVRGSLMRIETHSAVLGSLLETLHAALFLLVLLAAIGLHVAFAVLATFLVLLNRIQPHLRSIEWSRAKFASAVAQMREVDWLLDPAGKSPPAQGLMPFSGLRQRIKFTNVSFAYDNRPEQKAVEDLSFTIERGRSLAVIGRSGSGKTTLVNLLCGLLQPQKGTIEVDGVPLAELDGGQWRQRIGIAGQDIDLCDGTIADNIAFGRHDATTDSIWNAAKQANADGFIDELPLGLQTQVGDRGLALSGGQRQRIGIARALIRNPDILILDEATSAVDGLSERAIIDIVSAGQANRATIVISHRVDTLNNCDDGIVLSAGQMVERGDLRSLRFFKAMESGRRHVTD